MEHHTILKKACKAIMFAFSMFCTEIPSLVTKPCGSHTAPSYFDEATAFEQLITS